MKAACLAVVCGLLASLACGSDKRPLSATGGASTTGGSQSDVGESAVVPDAFGTTECRGCFAKACASQEAACASEPACATFLRCVDRCPSAESGAVDDDCAGGCARPESAESLALALDVQNCRTSGHGAVCNCGQDTDVPALLRQSCGPSDQEDGCKKCQEERCCDTRRACTEEPSCLEYFDCAKACPLDESPSPCVFACGLQFPEGFALSLPLLACTVPRCPHVSECAVVEPDPCSTCSDQRCAKEYVACFSNVACRREVQCQTLCEAGKCPPECATPDPEGVRLQDEFASCTAARCVSECG